MSIINYQISIINKEIKHPGKLTLVKLFIKRISGKKTIYELIVNDDHITVEPSSKSLQGLTSITNGINQILNENCEEMSNKGYMCEDKYDCCNCGGNDCGCHYCFSCNACESCQKTIIN